MAPIIRAVRAKKAPNLGLQRGFSLSGTLQERLFTGSRVLNEVVLAASASNLHPQLLTHSLKRFSTAWRLLSHHSALYVTPTSRCAVGSREATCGSTLGIDSLFIGAYGMNSESRWLFCPDTQEAIRLIASSLLAVPFGTTR